ncbi:MAG: molybdopterin-binding protein [Eubacteriales bacterium]|nr:molybdopterin-binding protein [Eubacteriales bacterium]
MKLIDTINAKGHVLCQDITQIIPNKYKGAKFRKGHIVEEEDIPILLSMGKEHLYIWEKDDSKYHENEAAEFLYEICASENMTKSEVKEGKIEGNATIDGLLKVDVELLEKINSLGEMMIATRYNNLPIKKGEKLFGTRIIPLVIEKEKINKALQICNGKKILKLLPYKQKKIGIVTTGSEVYKGLIEDEFGPVLKKKAEEYNQEVIKQIKVDDDPINTKNAIFNLIDEGANVILCSGGMSVDPDDRTPLAIKNTGAKIVSYGAPVLPGAMFLLSYLTIKEKEKTIPILGLPGCVMYAKRTIFDLVFPRILADDIISEKELSKLGRGGLCLNCNECHYPNCEFGKGW